MLQDATTDDFIFDVPTLVAYASEAFTLEPGDVILTGTPSGVGVFRDPPVAMQDGDTRRGRDRADRRALEPGRRRELTTPGFRAAREGESQGR